jgi:YD repeat-containing protein
MDRRQVIVRMTVMGVAGSLNLNNLLSAQSIDGVTQNIPARFAHWYDSERRELLGPVKKCVEESSDLVTTREYSPDGKLVTIHMEQGGKPLYSPSDSSYSEMRDTEGRMLRYSSPNREGVIQETSYDYDKAGRLLAITNNQNSDRTEFHYQADGSKSSTQTFDPKTIEATRNAGFSGSAWDADESGFGVPIGGTVITTYDENENPLEMRISRADGQLVSQFVRKYDASGRLVEEKPLQQNTALEFLDRILEGMTPEQRAAFTPGQRQAWIKGMNVVERGKLPARTTYSYDAQNRLTEKRERNMIFDHTTTIDYNQQGDKARERQTFKNNSVVPMGASWSFDEQGNPIVSNPDPGQPERDHRPPDTDVHYAYQYDSFGNWTEKIETRDDGSSFTTRRTITYY